MSKKRSKKERHPSPIIGSDGEEQFFVEKILDKDEVDGCWMYKIRWAGYSPTHDTWEEAERMQGEVPEIAEEFEKKLAARKRKSQTKSESSQPRSSSDESSVKAGSDEKKPKKHGTDEHLTASLAKKKSDQLAHFEDAIDSVINSSRSQNEMTSSGASASFVTDMLAGSQSSLGERAVRPQIDREDNVSVKRENSDSTLDASLSSGRSSVVDKQVPTGCRDLRTMLDEVEVVFCDIRKHLNFTSKKTNTTVVFVMNEAEKPLQNLKNDDIEWAYAILQRRDNGERRVLVKVKGTDRRAVVDYNSISFFNKFPEVCTEYLNVLHHYRRCWTEVERNIEEYEKKAQDFTSFWQENGKNEDDEIHKNLPEQYKSELNPAKAVEDYLNQMVEDNKVLYFYKLSKIYILSQIHSAEGATTVVACIKNAHEKRESQFKSIQFDVVTTWTKKWFSFFSLP